MRKPKFAYAKSASQLLCETKAQISFAVTAKLITAFVFATRLVQFLYFLNSKLQASSLPLCLPSLVCVGPVRRPHFFHDAAHISLHSGSIFVIVIVLNHGQCSGHSMLALRHLRMLRMKRAKFEQAILMFSGRFGLVKTLINVICFHSERYRK